MVKNKDQKIKLTKSEFLKQIAVETAKMSYPGGMSRGIPPIVKAGTKAALQEYFENTFPIDKLWDEQLNEFNDWHKERVEEISKRLAHKYYSKNRSANAISAKFLNTFMHQLMKYKKFRYLYKKLHLPLDTQVFNMLSGKLNGLVEHEDLRTLVSQYNAYEINDKQYNDAQEQLGKLLKSYNKVLPEDCQLQARIELNSVLWIS